MTERFYENTFNDSTNDLHIWCSVKEEAMKESKNNQETANKEAGITVSVIKNVIIVLKHGQ